MATQHTTSFGVVRSMALGGLCCCALLAGCASQYKTGAAAGMAVASAALADAEAADTNRYASADILVARLALSEAGAAMNERAYERAGLLALQAETGAKLARARVETGKAQLAANELNESTRLLQSELGRSRQ
jgi:hypothetical protein